MKESPVVVVVMRRENAVPPQVSVQMPNLGPGDKPSHTELSEYLC